MKSAALDLLASLGPSQVLIDAYDNAQSMTEAVAALEALGECSGPAHGNHAHQAGLAARDGQAAGRAG